MKCRDCPDRKLNDAVDEMQNGVEWFCMKKHSDCDEVVCLLRMVIWELAHLEDLLEEKT